MDLVVRVRASGDSSLTSVFRPLLAASAQAQRQVEAAASRSGKATQSIYRESGRAAVQAADQAARAAEKSAGDEVRSRERALAHVARIRERYFREEQRRGEQADKLAAQNAAKAIAWNQQVASAALRTFGGLAQAGIETAKEVGAGFEIDFSLQGGLSRGMARNSTAIALSNAAYKDGGPRESVAGLESTAMAVGAKYKLDPTGVIEGLAQYQKLTGDLATGKAGLDGLAALAGATTTKLDDMFAAAGNVGNALGEVGKEFKTPLEKAKAVDDVMRSVAAFGQEGAVEISDLSKQMAKVAAAASFFEGDRGENLKKMTALAQIARASGGASSATQAATSVQGFADILKTPARRAQFREAGIDIDSKTHVGQLRDPIAIIKDALVKTGGAIEPMKKLFANVEGEQAVAGLATTYAKAGGGDAGMKAVDAMLAKFSGTMSDKQIRSNNEERMKGKEAAGIDTQIQLDQVYAELGTALLPALREFTPVAKGAAEALGGIVKFGAAHPGLAITAAIVASIGKASLGEAAGMAVGKMLSSMTPATAGLGLLAGAAIAAALAIMSYVEKSDKEKDKGSADPRLIEKANEELKRTGTLSQETIDKIAMRRAEVAGMQSALKTGGVETQDLTAVAIAELGYDKAGTIATGEGATRDAKEKGKEGVDALAGKLDALIAAYKDSEKKPKGPIDVNIIGGMPSPGPAVNNAARSGGVN